MDYLERQAVFRPRITLIINSRRRIIRVPELFLYLRDVRLVI